jgi:hypothetical protein
MLRPAIHPTAVKIKALSHISWSLGSEDCAILVRSFQLSAISSLLNRQAGSDAS